MNTCPECGFTGSGKFCTRCGAVMTDEAAQRSLDKNQDYYSKSPAPSQPAVYDQTTPVYPSTPYTQPYFSPSMLPPEYRPITMWGYFGYQILFFIPVIGWLILIIYACGGTSNINVRNFARSYFCVAILVIGLFFLLFSGGMFAYMFSYH